MSEPESVVYVVDDDPDVLKALERLLSSAGLSVATFLSAQSFLQRFDSRSAACLILDLALKDSSGLDLQHTLADRASILPIIFLTGHGDITTSVRAMKHGASDFLTKPVDQTELLAAVETALARQQVLHRERAERERIMQRTGALTARERQVLEGIVAGRLNKQIAADLGTAEKTVKFHRGNLMRKLGVRTLTDLVKLAQRAGIGEARP